MATGCSRPPQGEICPTLKAGDLVLTELRGTQAGGADTYGQWIELANRSGEDVDLYGLKIFWRLKNGRTPAHILVREHVVVPTDGLVVLGHHRPDQIRDFVDYSFFSDYYRDPSEMEDGDTDAPPPEENFVRDFQAKEIIDEGIIELLGCGDEVIERLVYNKLPEMGSFALDGSLPPDAEDNNDLSRWCNDMQEATGEGSEFEIGLPGTPGEVNPPCN